MFQLLSLNSTRKKEKEMPINIFEKKILKKEEEKKNVEGEKTR